jgi:hypothetical protein
VNVEQAASDGDGDADDDEEDELKLLDDEIVADGVIVEVLKVVADELVTLVAMELLPRVELWNGGGRLKVELPKEDELWAGGGGGGGWNVAFPEEEEL